MARHAVEQLVWPNTRKILRIVGNNTDVDHIFGGFKFVMRRHKHPTKPDMSFNEQAEDIAEWHEAVQGSEKTKARSVIKGGHYLNIGQQRIIDRLCRELKPNANHFDFEVKGFDSDYFRVGHTLVSVLSNDAPDTLRMAIQFVLSATKGRFDKDDNIVNVASMVNPLDLFNGYSSADQLMMIACRIYSIFVGKVMRKFSNFNFYFPASYDDTFIEIDDLSFSLSNFCDAGRIKAQKSS